MLKFSLEGLGTLTLAVAIGLTLDPIAAGLVLMALLYIGFSITTVHLNPAVSLGVWSLNKESSPDLLLRLSGQFSGAVGGAFIVSWISRITYIPKPSDSTGVGEFIMLELLFSLIFVLLFLVMLYPAAAMKKSLTALVGGAGYAGFLLVVEPVTGFGLHPALNSAFSLFDYLDGGSSYSYLPIYFFTPLVGALLAALIHKRLMKKNS